ncbi:MAG: hypothetical protein KAS92_05305 [Candidatus Omnitrophica bacterium]|nr:hypothetical protein [Candidatus Omnitrophota bacterium]MCK5178297.1 hypothetical protein [Candidatus Omnitrophota bacterium]
MKKTFSILFIGTLVVLGMSPFVIKAEAETILGDYLKDKGVEVEVSAAVDVYSKYVWRGFLLDDDHVLQPGVTLSSNGFEGGFWGSWDLQGDDALASDEVDGWIGYSFDVGFLGESWEKVSFSLGNTWYDFPEADLYTKEFYLGVAVDTFLSPYVTWYSDYDEEAHGGADGNYIMTGIGHSFDLLEEYGVSLDLGLEYGYNDNAFIDGTGSYLLSTAGLSIPLTEKISASPNIGYSVPYGDLASGGGNDQKEQFYGGISLAFNF